MTALTLKWFDARDLDLREVEGFVFADAETAQRMQALRPLERAAEGGIVCGGAIWVADELGAVIVASRIDESGTGFSTSQPVCDGCAKDPDGALERRGLGWRRLRRLMTGFWGAEPSRPLTSPRTSSLR
jgi:hypothetical protein